jgi:hypothetical protein
MSNNYVWFKIRQIEKTMDVLRIYIKDVLKEGLHPSQLNTVGQTIDLIQDIQDIQDETDKSSSRRKIQDVGVEFFKIAMGEIPVVGGALGVIDGVIAMYQAGKNEEHTWAELEEYPILARMKLHPSLAKHLDPITLREIDVGYQEYLKTLSRGTEITSIVDIDDYTREWILKDTNNSLDVEILREFISEFNAKKINF